MSHVQGRVCPILHVNWLRSIGVALVMAGVAHAVTITVPCSGSGGGPGGLAAAINTANSTLGPNTINLTPGCAYTLSRTYRAGSPNGLPPITGIITINGYGATIGRSQVAGTPTFRLFAVLTGGSLTLNTVTVRGGSVNIEGGLEPAFVTGGGLSIAAGGKLTLNHSVVTQNHVGAIGGQCCGFAGGGGIYNLGTVTLNYSVVSTNVALSDSESGIAQGGGIYNRGALNLQCSTVTHNTATQRSQNEGGNADGGGIFSAAGGVIVRHSVVSYNTANANPVLDAHSNGGGIVVDKGSTAILAYSAIRNNIVAANGGFQGGGSTGLGGGIEVEGTATLYRSAIFSNTVTSSGSDFTRWPNASGGGLAIPACEPLAGSSTCSTGKAKLYYVAIYSNSTHAPSGLARGGGIEAGGPVSLNYSKVLNNTTQGATLADSLGGGIYNSNSASGAVILTATQVQGNHPDQCDPTGSIPGCSN